MNTLLKILQVTTEENVMINRWAIIGLYILLIIILLFVSNAFTVFKKKVMKASINNYINTEAKLQSIEFSINGIISADSDGKIIAWNQGATHMFGWKEEEVLGKNLVTIIPERFRTKHLQAMEKYKNTGTPNAVGKTLRLFALHKDKHEFPIEMTLSSWVNNNHMFFTGIIRDTTEEMKEKAKADKIAMIYREAEKIDNSGTRKWNILTDEVTTTEGFREIFEVEEGKDNFSSLMNRIFYEDRVQLENVMRNAIAKKEDYEIKYKIISMNGRPKKIHVKAKVVIGDTGEVEKIIGTVHEIPDTSKSIK